MPSFSVNPPDNASAIGLGIGIPVFVILLCLLIFIGVYCGVRRYHKKNSQRTRYNPLDGHNKDNKGDNRGDNEAKPKSNVDRENDNKD